MNTSPFETGASRSSQTQLPSQYSHSPFLLYVVLFSHYPPGLSAIPSRGHVSLDDISKIVEECRESFILSPALPLTASGPALYLDQMTRVISLQRSIAFLFLALDKSSSSENGVLDKFDYLALQSVFTVLSCQDAVDPSLTDVGADDALIYRDLFYRLFAKDLVNSCKILLLTIHSMNQHAMGEPGSMTRDPVGSLLPKATLVKAVDSTARTLLERICRRYIHPKWIVALSALLFCCELLQASIKEIWIMLSNIG